MGIDCQVRRLRYGALVVQALGDAESICNRIEDWAGPPGAGIRIDYAYAPASSLWNTLSGCGIVDRERIGARIRRPWRLKLRYSALLLLDLGLVDRQRPERTDGHTVVVRIARADGPSAG